MARLLAPRRPFAAHPPFAVLAVALAVAVGACEPADRDGSSPRYGGTAVIVAASDLQPSSPLTVTESWTFELFTGALFLPLVVPDGAGGYEPALAERWEQEGDSVVVFHLRRDVRWHDGVPTTAADVAFTFERATTPETGFPNPAYFRGWSAPEAVDSFTIRFRVDPSLDPLMGWSRTGIVPRHLLEDVPPESLRRAEYNLAPVGNGPFRFVSRTSNDRWVFEANPTFPEALGGRPYLDRLVWRVVPEPGGQLTELLTGRAHLMTGPRADQLDRHGDRDDVRALIRPTRRYTFIGWNGRRGPLGDARVRRALAMALDRERMLRATRGGYGTLAATPVPPSHFAHDSALAPVGFDPERARALLDSAGLVDRDGDGMREDRAGERWTIELKIPANNAFNRDVAELIRGDLEAVGVRLRTRATEAATLIGDITSPERRFDAVLLASEADPRLDLRPLFHSAMRDGPYQLAGYGQPAVDALLDSLAAVTDRGAARPLWHRLQRRLRDDQPWTVLWFAPDLFLVRRELRGVEMDKRGPFITLQRWWLEEPTTGSGRSRP